jgi:hypothetical protein
MAAAGREVPTADIGRSRKSWHAQPLPPIAGSGRPPFPAMATTPAFFPGAAGRRAQGLVSMGATQACPRYPEVRWAVQKAPACGAAQAAQRADGQPASSTRAPSRWRTRFRSRASIRRRTTSRMRWTICSSTQDDLPRPRGRRPQGRQGTGLRGAWAWFQPYHVWTEETWGI